MENQPSNPRISFFYDETHSKVTPNSVKAFYEYSDHLRSQFSWLTKYLPPPRLDHFLHLVAFSTFNIDDPHGKKHIQLRDLHLILALWDLDLLLTDRTIPQEILTSIDAYMCDLTHGFCKHGLVTQFDLFFMKQELLSDLGYTDDEILSVCLDNTVSPTLRERIKQLISLSIIPN